MTQREELLRKYLPRPLFDFALRTYQRLQARTTSKAEAELGFWKSRFELDNGDFVNSHYRKLMLAMAERQDESFVAGKAIADFGCGPRGSLIWARGAVLRAGIDVLAHSYADNFYGSLIQHGMVYVTSTEKVIPVPSEFFDVVFSLNSLDHVDHFSVMCDEIIRIMKKGGEFIGSFNLEEPRTASEPQMLTEALIKTNLLDKLEVLSYRTAPQGPEENPYAAFISGESRYESGSEGYLWVRAIRRN